MFGVSPHGQEDGDDRIGGTSTAVLEERRERCLEELRAAADVPAFESRGIDAFRGGLRGGIEAALSASRDAFWAKGCGGGASGDYGCAIAAVPSSSSSIVRYDGETIETCLSPHREGINWSGLLLDHDAACSRRASSVSGATRSTSCTPKDEGEDAPFQRTALNELLDALLDPTLMPSACVGSVFLVLVRAYVEGGAPSSGRSEGPARQPPAAAASDRGGIEGRYPSSAELLRRSMSRLLRRSPLLSPADLLGPCLHSKLRINLPPSVHHGTGKESTDALNAAMHRYDVNAAHRVLSLVKFFVGGSERRRMEVCAMRSIVGCIMDIDNLDVWLMRSRDGSAGRASSVREVGRRQVSSGGNFKALCCSRCRLSRCTGRERSDGSEQRETSRRKAKTIGISDLHDVGPQGQEDEEGCGISIKSVDYADGRRTERVSISRQFQQPPMSNRVSMKKVMSIDPSSATDTGSMTAPCPCLGYTDLSTGPSPAQDNTNSRQLRCSLLPLKMVQLRSDLYRAILSMTIQQSALPRGEDLCRNDSPILPLPSLKRRNSDAPLFRLVIRMMHRYSLCAAARLCAVLVADARGIEKGYLPLMKTIWDASISSLLSASSTLSDRARERCENSLRAYSELIVELAVFDGPDNFWEVMKPLLDCVLDLCRGNQEDEDRLTPGKDITEGGKSLVDSWQTKEYRVKWLLRAVSYVLVHRRNTLSSVDSTKVQNSVTQLSIYCSEEDLWISRSMPPAERTEVTRTLQAMGVLSFIGEADMKRNDETVADEAAARIYKDYPFTLSSSLRDAVGRMGPKVGCNIFLSSRNARQTMLESNPKERTSKRRREDSLSESLPLLEYLNDDTIRLIFSFLGYRRLARVTGTCKLWNALGNEPGLWRRHYVSRFKPLLGKDIVSKLATPPPPPHISARFVGAMEEGMDWRKLFDAKWAAERSLRSSFSRCGTWRHRTCGVVGCLSVLKSRAQYEKHVNKHRNDLAKKIDRQIASEERKKKREKDRAAREERLAEEKLARKNKATK